MENDHKDFTCKREIITIYDFPVECMLINVLVNLLWIFKDQPIINCLMRFKKKCVIIKEINIKGLVMVFLIVTHYYYLDHNIVSTMSVFNLSFKCFDNCCYLIGLKICFYTI